MIWIAGGLFTRLHSNEEKFLLETSEIEESIGIKNDISVKSFVGCIRYRKSILLRFMFFDDLLKKIKPNDATEACKILLSKKLYVFASDFARIIILNFFSTGFYLDFDVEPRYFYSNENFFSSLNEDYYLCDKMIFQRIEHNKGFTIENSVIFVNNTGLFEHFLKIFIFHPQNPSIKKLSEAADIYINACKKAHLISSGYSDFESGGNYYEHYSLFKKNKEKEFMECDMQEKYKNSILFQARYVEDRGNFIRRDDNDLDKSLGDLQFFYLCLVDWIKQTGQYNENLSKNMSNFFQIPYRNSFPTVYSWYFPWFKRMVEYHENQIRENCPTLPANMTFDPIIKKTVTLY